MANIFQKLTVDCEREDCAISFNGASSTCMGWTDTYDKRGNKLAGNPNVITSHYSCGRCGARWAVTGDSDKTCISKTQQSDDRTSDSPNSTVA